MAEKKGFLETCVINPLFTFTIEITQSLLECTKSCNIKSFINWSIVWTKFWVPFGRVATINLIQYDLCLACTSTSLMELELQDYDFLHDFFVHSTLQNHLEDFYFRIEQQKKTSLNFRWTQCLKITFKEPLIISE